MLVSRPDISTTELQDFGSRNFLKLNLTKYMGLLGLEPIPPQIALVNAINNPNIRFVCAALSRRTGKTYISNIIGQLSILVPGSEILIMGPNYAISQISWDLQRNFIRQFDLEKVRDNAKDKLIELSNNSIIRVGSVKQPDAVIGRSYKLIIFDEAAINKDGEDVFNVQLRPTLDRIDSKAIFISTFRGKNWFYDFYLRGFSDEFPEWASILSTYLDNPRTDLRDIEQARKSLSRAVFAQEYECDPVVMEGTIWALDPAAVVDMTFVDGVLTVDGQIVEYTDVIGGMDLGFRDPTAFCVIFTDGNNIYIFDEYQAAESVTDVHGRALQGFIEKYGIDFIYIDSSAQQTKFDLAMNWGIPSINANKSILDGIGYVSSLVDNGRIFVNSSCPRVIDTFRNYVWDNREGLIAEKALHNEYSHMADAIRYAVYTYSPNLEGLE